jgi:hypothetical protein
MRRVRRPREIDPFQAPKARRDLTMFWLALWLIACIWSAALWELLKKLPQLASLPFNR